MSPGVDLEPESKIDIGQKCTICTEAVFSGDVTVGDGTVIHPRAQILAVNGPIVIGENNLIEENAIIININNTNLTIRIIIGDGTVIHPRAQILAVNGPIVIGENNLIEENAIIINRIGDEIDDKTLTIGNYNVFEIGCKVEANSIGDYNTIEAKAYVGPCVKISKGCTVGAKCSIELQESLPENIVLFGNPMQRRINPDKPSPQVSQLEFLRKVLPNYHYLKKSTVVP